MDFLNDMKVLLFESSSEDMPVQRRRRDYRSFDRKTVDTFDDVDFHMYFRLTKKAFRRLHELVGANLVGDAFR